MIWNLLYNDPGKFDISYALLLTNGQQLVFPGHILGQSEYKTIVIMVHWQSENMIKLMA